MKRMERDTSICKYCENPEVCNLESCAKAKEDFELINECKHYMKTCYIRVVSCLVLMFFVLSVIIGYFICIFGNIK